MTTAGESSANRLGSSPPWIPVLRPADGLPWRIPFLSRRITAYLN